MGVRRRWDLVRKMGRDTISEFIQMYWGGSQVVEGNHEINTLICSEK